MLCGQQRRDPAAVRDAHGGCGAAVVRELLRASLDTPIEARFLESRSTEARKVWKHESELAAQRSLLAFPHRVVQAERVKKQYDTPGGGSHLENEHRSTLE